MNLKSPTTRFPIEHTIMAMAVSAALAIYFYANVHGLGFTYDSVHYLKKSIIFAENHSLQEIGFNGLFPFQSLEIVLLSFFGDHALIVMKYLHALLLGGAILMHLIIAKDFFKNRKTLAYYAGTLVFSTPLLMVHCFLWTEPLFIFFVSLQWYLLWRFFQHKTLQTLIFILLISILYCLQRKAGMLFSLGLVLAFITNFVSSKKQILVILIFLALSIIILYGELGTSNLIGELPVLSSFPVNLKNYSNALSAWIFPLPLNYWIRTGLFISISVFVGFIFWKTLPKIPTEKKTYITSIIIIILTYLVIRHFYFRPHFHEADRFLAPIYPGIFFLFIFVIEHVVLKTRQSIVKLILPVLMALWLTYPVIRTLKNAQLWHNRTKNPLLIKEKTQDTNKK